eukprot:CAMPEP_0117611744 /NCGR_PEP_ID=MMETSP0784-20121206/82565_1 /TAXON_ID=39447 /ORGANISM="" /LENGTH=49 /DNA_ID= /DNA_START= /DNA_END= /DNA_ORIENTATION=
MANLDAVRYALPEREQAPLQSVAAQFRMPSLDLPHEALQLFARAVWQKR